MNNTKELRAFLVKQMNGVADGSVDLDGAKAVSNLSQQIYNTLNIEVKMAIAMDKMEGREINPVNFGD